MRLGDLLVEAGVLTREQLGTALGHQQLHGGRLGTNLVELEMVSEDALAAALSRHLHLPSVNQAAIDKASPDALARLPSDVAERHRVVPIRIDGNRLWLAMSDPTDQRAISEISQLLTVEVRPMVAPETVVANALGTHYGLQRKVSELQIVSHHGLELLLDDGRPSDGAAAQPASRLADLNSPGATQRTPIREPLVAGRLGLHDLGTRLVAATSKTDLADAVLAFIGQDFARVALVTIRGAHLIGWRGHGATVNQEALRQFSAPRDAIPVIARALTDDQPLLGRGSPATLGALTKALGAPGEAAILVLPLRSGGEPFGCVAAVGGREGAEAWLDDYAACAKKLDLAFQLVALRKRILVD